MMVRGGGLIHVWMCLTPWTLARAPSAPFYLSRIFRTPYTGLSFLSFCFVFLGSSLLHCRPPILCDHEHITHPLPLSSPSLPRSLSLCHSIEHTHLLYLCLVSFSLPPPSPFPLPSPYQAPNPPPSIHVTFFSPSSTAKSRYLQKKKTRMLLVVL